MSVEAEVERAAYLVPPGRIEGLLDWESIFGNDRPVEVEVGCGKGRFLMERALAYPDRNLLGLDWGIPWLRRTGRRLGKAGIENVRLLRTNAKHVLQHLVPAGSLTALHVYFPDPWPKKRHRKRRLFDDETTAAMERILAPDGRLHVATDQDGYFEEILEVLARCTRLRHLPEERTAGGRISSFAVKYAAEGRRIHEAVWARKEAP